MRKYLIVMIIFAALITLLFGYSVFQKQRQGMKIMNGPTQTAEVGIKQKSRRINDFTFLKIGMDYKEIVDTLGLPDAAAGYGVIMVKYRLEDGRYLVLNFGPYGRTLKKALLEERDGTWKSFIE